MITDDAQTKAAAAYNAAADSYDDPLNSFWPRFGRKTIERLDLRTGENVLDVCCGSGASAIPAAEKVGVDGSVLGVDLAENLLALARAKARHLALHNIEFRVGDMLDLRLPESHFDAVVCVFGIFFVPDMAAAVRALWRLVRPGGRLAITTWGPHFFEPVNSVFWNAIREVRPDLYKGFHPWDRICEPQSLLVLLHEAGIEEAEIVAEAGEHSIPSPEAWWSAVLGSGFRGTIDQLNANDREHVHAVNLDFIRQSGIHSVEANVIYGIAKKT
jgi:ubiquinone/menaquinone biosynthesis C-methylase UbiE